MKVVAVSWRDLAHPSAGGAEVMMDQLLSGLCERGHEVALVAGGPVRQRAYEVIDAGGTYSQYLRAPWVCTRRFRSADVIIDTENGLPYFSPLWRRRPSVCLVHHVHLDQWQARFPAPVSTVCRALERHVMPAVYRNRTFVAVSSSTAEALKAMGVNQGRIRVIESGVAAPLGPVSEKSMEPLFLSLNRLVPHKRIDLLLQAWRTASQFVPGRLVVAGDGPELANVRRVASSIPRVEVLGRVTEQAKADLLGKSWAVVSAAHHEGWGMSVMEAAALGTPAIAVDAPGMRDSIVDGVTGILVRSKDQLGLTDALADAMKTFARDPDLQLRLGSAARRRAGEFSWSRSIDLWEQLLNERSRMTLSERGEASPTSSIHPAGAIESAT